MNALPLPPPPPNPRPRRSGNRRPERNRVLAAEATVKLGVNVLISSAAIAALIQLVPHSMMQQAKLKEIRSEVKTANTRVDRLKAEFSRNFDPRQASTIVQEQTNRADPTQKMVVLGDRDATPPAAPAPQP